MDKSLRLLKFDSAHPEGCLQRLQQQRSAELASLDYKGYYEWLMDLRLGMSDFLTHPMNEAGWVAREFLAKDRILMRKLGQAGEIARAGLGGRLQFALRQALSLPVSDAVSFRWTRGADLQWRYWLIRNYVATFRPDVIFVREPAHIDGDFFNAFRDKCTLVALIGCNTNHAQHWDPHRYDVVFTLTEEYQRFFTIQGINSHVFEYGVDDRLQRQVSGLPKKYDCTFVGFLGQPTQSRKTELMDHLASRIEFKWWGVKGSEISKFPALLATWQGEVAGLEMFQIYKQSRIVLNDYVDMAGGANVNIRTKEVLGVGSMLLTREADNVRGLEAGGALVTFRDADDCVSKARHYLAHDPEREKIAECGLQTALQRFNYRSIARNVMSIIGQAHEKKNAVRRGPSAWRSE